MEKTYKTRNKCNEERERKKNKYYQIYKGKKENTIVKIEKP